ncbi:MAG: CZB domain-containing protein [Desulfobulbaceae bacterium]|nr:CZB domain-containing protein [Desulfobulbaceae bacterium]
MKAKSFSVRIKLFLGLFTLLALTAGFILFSFYSFAQLADKSHRAARAGELLTEMTRQNVYLLTWSADVAAEIADETDADTDIDTDDRKCTFGLWLYGSGRQSAESEFPSLAPFFKSMEEPHAAMHAAAARIVNGGRQDAPELINLLRQTKNDQQEWMNEIENALLEDQNTLDDALSDPTRCRLGSFLYSDRMKEAYLTDPELAGMLHELEPLHKRLHGSISDIRKFLDSGDRIGAAAYVQRTAVPVFRATAARIDEIIAFYAPGDDVKQLHSLYTNEIIPLRKQVQAILADANDLIRKHTATDKAFTADLLTTGRNIGIAGAAIIFLGLLAVFLGTRSLVAARDRKEDAPPQASFGINDQARRASEEKTGDADPPSPSDIESSEQVRTNTPEADLSALVDLFTEIADQAKILSLNIAIESARSSAQDKGLYFIAEDINKLSRRSSEAAENIAQIMRSGEQPAIPKQHEKDGQLPDRQEADKDNPPSQAPFARENETGSGKQNNPAQDNKRP